MRQGEMRRFRAHPRSTHIHFRNPCIWTVATMLALLFAPSPARSATSSPFYVRPFAPSQYVLGSGIGAGGSQQVADDFVLDADQTLGHVEWWGGIFGGNRTETQTSRSFVIRLYASAGAQPADTPFFQTSVSASVTDTGVVGTHPNANNFKIFNYSSDIAEVSLSAGGAYWLSVLSTEPTPQSQWVWYASDFVPGAGVYRRDADTEPWISETQAARNAMSMALAIPEPHAAAGLAIAFVGFSTARSSRGRKRRRDAALIVRVGNSTRVGAARRRHTLSPIWYPIHHGNRSSAIHYLSGTATACPFCGQVMQPGWVLGDRWPLQWQPRDKPRFLWFSSGHRIGTGFGWSRPRAYGLRCERCRKIILDERSAADSRPPTP
jgi:hypothetical protein